MQPPIQILAVEDDEIDAELLQRHLRCRSIEYTLTVLPTPQEAWGYLCTQAVQPAASLPHLILLDLNLPGTDGLSFLHTLRQDPKLRRSIVFILTTSDLPNDKRAAYENCVAGYVLKQNVPRFLQWLDSYCSLIEFPPRPIAAAL